MSPKLRAAGDKMSFKLVVKGYQIGPRIDQIGFKTIYRGIHLTSQKEVFITLIACRPGPSQKNLLKRAALSQKLAHPQLVAASDYSVLEDGRFYYAHPAIPSFPLKRIVADVEDAPERWLLTVRFFLQFLDTLDYIHRANTTHRDLNLSHLRVDLDDRVLTEGFINARPRVEPSSMVHLVHLPYLAPEQLMSRPADAKTDIYAAGVILYELLTGKLPYSSNYSKLEAAKKGTLPNPLDDCPDLPKELVTSLLTALAPRKNRYSSLSPFIADLTLYHQKRPFAQKLKDLSQNVLQMLFLRKV